MASGMKIIQEEVIDNHGEAKRENNKIRRQKNKIRNFIW